ncbi:hypothetical protein DB88DRAFT_473692 [Papiliotrema laurentii]|uniref:Uncharacterized protein n=1 Tax=Papiliotrema laurentii TaxID=5418 RepID=A0AAD9CVW3_PAPLA|nr:hypothetical protein DB88DRAFT_475817 [Papiliotrema laurentii]KAK1923056.1 hypothetical protein DB88DRAFT_473692 [Papiliotrema laurentii]
MSMSNRQSPTSNPSATHTNPEGDLRHVYPFLDQRPSTDNPARSSPESISRAPQSFNGTGGSPLGTKSRRSSVSSTPSGRLTAIDPHRSGTSGKARSPESESSMVPDMQSHPPAPFDPSQPPQGNQYSEMNLDGADGLDLKRLLEDLRALGYSPLPSPGRESPSNFPVGTKGNPDCLLALFGGDEEEDSLRPFSLDGEPTPSTQDQPGGFPSWEDWTKMYGNDQDPHDDAASSDGDGVGLMYQGRSRTSSLGGQSNSSVRYVTRSGVPSEIGANEGTCEYRLGKTLPVTAEPVCSVSAHAPMPRESTRTTKIAHRSGGDPHSRLMYYAALPPPQLQHQLCFGPAIDVLCLRPAARVAVFRSRSMLCIRPDPPRIGSPPLILQSPLSAIHCSGCNPCFTSRPFGAPTWSLERPPGISPT